MNAPLNISYDQTRSTIINPIGTTKISAASHCIPFWALRTSTSNASMRASRARILVSSILCSIGTVSVADVAHPATQGFLRAPRVAIRPATSVSRPWSGVFFLRDRLSRQAFDRVSVLEFSPISKECR